MTLRWHRGQSVATVKPVPGITLCVVRWSSNTWGWHIEKGEPTTKDGLDVPIIAKGRAKNRTEGEAQVEQAWLTLKPTLGI